jgi:pimeloyl-ACP methyl ester carboxylesterase
MSLVRKEIEVNGRSTEVLTAGQGDPVVFLHGAGIVEGFECLEPLSEQFSLVCPLIPGYGATELDPPLEGRAAVVEHTRDVLDALGLDRVVLVGFSMGGWLAASFASTFPGRVSALVLGAPFGLDVPGHPMANIMAMDPEQTRRTLTTDPKVWEGRLPTGPDAEFEAARTREGQSLMRVMPGPSDPELPTLLPNVSAPTLLLWGSDDQLIPIAHLEAWKAALPHAASRTLPDTGHLLFHERPDAVAAIADFASAPVT